MSLPDLSNHNLRIIKEYLAYGEMSLLADKIGCNRTTVYNFFRGKKVHYKTQIEIVNHLRSKKVAEINNLIDNSII